jgi:type I restriction enzyme S subunit
MSEWKCYKLSEISSLSNGINFEKSAYTRGVKLIGVSDFKNRIHPDYDSLQEVDSKVVKSGDYLEKGDIVFVRSNGNKELVGRCMIIDRHIPVTYSGFCIKLRFKDKKLFEPVFFNYLFRTRHFKKSMTGTAVGANIQNLSQSRLGNCEVNVPDIETQKRIATILSRYDSLIENYQKQIKLLEEAAQRLYKEWFVDLHFPGHENTKIVDGVPEGWEKKTLGELFFYVRGKSYSSNEISDEGCIMVNLKNIQAFGGYKRDAEKRFIGKYKPEQTLQKGDLVMGVTDMTQERRLVGHVALIPDFNEPATFSMDLIKIIPYSVPIIYLYCAMRYGGISKQISPLANGVNVLHLKPDAMMGTMMVVPRKDLIERFCPFVEEMTNKILKNQSQIRLLTEARDRLLPKLMNGEIKV